VSITRTKQPQLVTFLYKV